MRFLTQFKGGFMKYFKRITMVLMAFSLITPMALFAVEETQTQEVNEPQTRVNDIDSWMPDKALQEGILNYFIDRGDLPLNSTPDDITKSALSSINSLELRNCGITNLTGIEYLVNLDELSLSNDYSTHSQNRNIIHDFSPISSLNNLTTLYASYVDYSGDLEFAKNLNRIVLEANHISSLKGIEDSTSLSFIGLQYNEIEDLTPAAKALENFVDTTGWVDYVVLEINNNKITDFSPLEATRNRWNPSGSFTVYADGQNIDDIPLVLDNANQIDLPLTYYSTIPIGEEDNIIIDHPDVKLINGKLDFSNVTELPETVTVTFAVNLRRDIADPIERKEYNFDFNDTVIFGYILDEDIDNLPPGRCNGYSIQYTYRVPKKMGSVTVNHVDEDGNNLTDPIILTGMEDEHYDTQSKTFKGYEYHHVVGNPSGLFTDSSQTVTYVYSKEAVVIDPEKPNTNDTKPKEPKPEEQTHDTPKSEDPNTDNQQSQNQNKLDKNGKNLPQTGINNNHYFGYLTILCGASMLTLSHLNRKND